MTRDRVIDCKSRGDDMRFNLTTFSMLGYGAVVAELISSLVTQTGYRIGSVVFTLVVAVLVWAASNGHRWAGSLFAVLTVLLAWATVAESWSTAPSWMRFGEPFEKVSTLEAAADVIAALLSIGATFVYFSGNSRAAAKA
jgi:hypothetical protein